MDPLCPRDDLLPADEQVVAVAVQRVVGTGHGVEGADRRRVPTGTPGGFRVWGTYRHTR